jgi:hypothetical protein
MAKFGLGEKWLNVLAFNGFFTPCISLEFSWIEAKSNKLQLCDIQCTAIAFIKFFGKISIFTT